MEDALSPRKRDNEIIDLVEERTNLTLLSGGIHHIGTFNSGSRQHPAQDTGPASRYRDLRPAIPSHTDTPFRQTRNPKAVSGNPAPGPHLLRVRLF